MKPTNRRHRSRAIHFAAATAMGWLAVTAASFSARPAWGQAYCALRDPITAIYEAFPEADAHQSIVRTIDESVRKQVSSEVPFSIHFNELGRHTLYLATKDEVPLGMIHVRSEEGRWGLIEIAWSLDVDVRVLEFDFQRCRSPKRAEIESAGFRNRLVGRSAEELVMMLDAGGTGLVDSFGLAPEAEELAATVIRSAVKTMLVTRHAWKEPVELIQLLAHSHASFPTGHETERLEPVFTREATDQIHELLGSNGTGTLDHRSSVGIRVLDDGGRNLGHLIRTPWKSMDQSLTLWWSVTPDLVIQSVAPEGGWRSKDLELSFGLLEGLSFEEVSGCGTTVEAVATEVLIVSRAHR